MFLYGFVGNAPCGGLLLEKLQACTQPGLDGYGAALMQGGQLLCVKSKESVTALAQQLPESAAPCGLVHARFATCGGRTAENVHPFVTDDYCLAMNGTVENAVALRSALNLLPYPDSDGAVLAALLHVNIGFALYCHFVCYPYSSNSMVTKYPFSVSFTSITSPSRLFKRSPTA